MKILILSWRGPGHPNAGGAEYVTHEHAKAWVRAGHEVTLFTSGFSGAKEKENINGVCVIRKGDQVLGVRLAAVKYYLFGGEVFDLVVDEFHGIPFFTPLFVRAKKLALIHEVAKNVWKLNPWRPPFNLIPYIIGTVFEPFVFKLLYTKVPFVTVSQSTKKDLVSFGIPEENISIIHNGIDVSAIPAKLPPKAKRKTAMFLGAISHDKGIKDALEAFCLINQTNRDWQFWIVGRSSPEMNEYLKNEVKRLGIKRNTKYWGFVSDKKKFSLLSRAHVLINPSVREGWGLVNIEANAVGTPVVGYDVPGVRDSVKMNKTGVLCKAKTPECLAKETEKLLADNKRYITLCRQGIEWANTFNWKVAGERSLELLKNIVV